MTDTALSHSTFVRELCHLLENYLLRPTMSFLVRLLSELYHEPRLDSMPVPSYASHSTYIPSALHRRLQIDSTSSNGKAPPELSTMLLVLLTGGALALLSFLALLLYCCVRCRRLKQRRALMLDHKGAAREKENGQSTSEEPGSSADDLEGGRILIGNGVASPSVFEFSPPSPSWRPTLPSLAFITGNGSGSGSTQNQLSNAEMIMREREPRWRRQGLGRRRGNGNGGNNQQRPQISQPRPFRGKVGIKANVPPLLPPLPPAAQRAYRPPAYHRPSRIIRVVHENTIKSVPGPARRTCTSPDREATRVPMGVVPRIQVHPARDVPSQCMQQLVSNQQTEQTARGGTDARASSKARTEGTGLERASSVRSERSVSGLGISTVNLDLDGMDATANCPSVQRDSSAASPYLSAQPFVSSQNSLGGISSCDGPRTGTGRGNGASARRAVSACSSILASDEDVRLAYTVSIMSIRSETNPEAGVTGGEMSSATETEVTRDISSRGDIAKTLPTKSGGVVSRVKSAPSKTKLFPAPVVPTTSKMMASVPSSDSGRRTKALPSITHSSSSKHMDARLSARSNSLRRKGLGAIEVDDVTKNELHAMRSLGSESFDSLIAYLEESKEPEEDQEEKARRARSATAAGTHGNEAMIVKNTDYTRITRDEAARVDERAYEAWVGSLNASPSVLKLTGVEVDRGGNGDIVLERQTSVRAGRRSRSASASTSGSRPGKSDAGTGVVSTSTRTVLRERDLNADLDSRKTGKAHTRKESFAESEDAVTRSSVQANVGMHVRALRARSASLKVKNQEKGSSVAVPDKVSNFGELAWTGTTTKTRVPQILSVKYASEKNDGDRRKQQESTHLSVKSNEAISSLPSFSIPSSATQLYAAFPSGVASSSGSLSGSSSKVSEDVGNANRSQTLSRVKSSAIPASSSPTSGESTISAAAYIARCVPTPKLSSAATLSFLSPSLSVSMTPSRSGSVQRRASMTGSVSSVESDGSAVSAWGRRSEWGRESLTPRFDHLRAVLEGRFGGEGDGKEVPPLPVLVKRDEGRARFV